MPADNIKVPPDPIGDIQVSIEYPLDLPQVPDSVIEDTNLLQGTFERLDERQTSQMDSLDIAREDVKAAITHLLHPQHNSAFRITKLDFREGFDCTAWRIHNTAMKGNEFWEK
jgi:hypothetical protein